MHRNSKNPKKKPKTPKGGLNLLKKPWGLNPPKKPGCTRPESFAHPATSGQKVSGRRRGKKNLRTGHQPGAEGAGRKNDLFYGSSSTGAKGAERSFF